MTFLRRALTACFLSVALVGSATAVAPTASAEYAWEGTSAAATTEYAKQLLTRVNTIRANRGLRRLQLETCTDGYAEDWADTMVRDDLWQHSDMGDLMRRCNATYASENLAGWAGSVSPSRIVRSWMDSDGHRRNLLTRKAGRVGMAVRYDSSRDKFYAVMDLTRLG